MTLLHHKPHGHGGNIRKLAVAAGRSPENIIDFSANINPIGPPEWLRPIISSHLSSVVHYPEPDCSLLRAAIGTRSGVKEEEVLVGNGSTELLYLLPRALPVSRALIPVPSYSDYVRAAEAAGQPVEMISLREDQGFGMDLSFLGSRLSGNELVFIGQPNNPTGRSVDTEALRSLVLNYPSTLFAVDESFIDFIEGKESLLLNRPDNVIVLRSLTKFYAIPGLRLGFAIGDVGLIAKMERLIPSWSVNGLAQAVGERIMQDDGCYATRSRTFVQAEREFLLKELQSLSGLTVYPGEANFFLLRIDRKGLDAPTLAKQLLSRGIAIRVCDNFNGLDGRFFRVAVRTRDENLQLVSGLKQALSPSLSIHDAPSRKKKPALMFQGTSSNAGKSVLAAALCRILLQDGYRVAPFKSQNMSLNSFVTRDGGEMGRAQVVQAQACRIDPDVRMNPILLKPTDDTGAQVILWGKPVGNMDVEQYIKYKPDAFEAAKRAFDSLSEENDVIVLEGAGSPAEVNLKSHDIANMRMADYAGATVVLVGDIDRGGVFASFVGTLEVLSEWERRLVAGFVINRFRGKKSLLDPAIEYTELHTGRPFFGVVPYLHDLGLPQEDSVEFKSAGYDSSSSGDERREGKEKVEIAVIDLPHISNFTDFDAFRIEPDVRLLLVRSLKDLNEPDVVILPGSKNVIGDLRFIRQSGLAGKITALAARGQTEVVGLCGGFQMLGEKISDPYGIEYRNEVAQGLGLLPVSTVMAREKTLLRAEGLHLPSGLRVGGYEIHHGQTDGKSLPPTVVREDGEHIGAGLESGLTWGTYLHGIFDSDGFRRWFIDRLRVRRGLSPVGKVCSVYDLEPALDRLADEVRKSLKLGEIYRLMGLK